MPRQVRALAAAALMASVTGGMGHPALAQPTDGPTASEVPAIEVTLDCYSSPERVTVTNNRARPVTVQRVGSTYGRRAGEPFRVGKRLPPGRSVSYTFGAGEGKGKRLSGSFIFDNEASTEGVLVRTDKGRLRVGCDEGTNATPADPGPAGLAAPQPAPVDRDAVRGPDLAIGPIDALELLATLPVEPAVDGGYARELFRHWVDADGDGCDTREEVLITESLTPVILEDGCRVVDGTWFSAPDGDTLTNPASIDINHVVPLKEAWASGARAWTPERREAFANDLLDERTLQAVSSGANRQQGENDPASWLPVDRDVACRFVADWVAIKASWDLSVDQAERDAIVLTLEDCDERMVTLVPREAPG